VAEPSDAPDGPPGKPKVFRYREYGLRPPRVLQRFCRETGGLNPFGGAMYRLSWAPSQLTWSAGKFRINDEHGTFKYWHIDAGWVPKYPGYGERYVLETWKAPEVYGSPFEWEALNHEYEEDGRMLGKLGPYPHLGSYEVCFHFNTSDTNEFVYPTHTLCERRIQEHIRMSRKKALLRAMAKEASDYEEFSKKREQSDILSEPFDGLNSLITPYVSLAGVDVPPAAPAAISTTQEVS
jgi:hypothetical protein